MDSDAQIDEIKCEFLIMGFEDGNEITSLLGINPTEIISKGDVKREDPAGINPPLLHDQNYWVLRTENPGSESEELLDLLLAKLRPKSKEILELSKKTNLEISIFGSVYHSQVGIHLSKSQLKELADLNIELDFDIYSLEED